MQHRPPLPWIRLLAACLMMAVSTLATAEKLSIERLFTAPDLSGDSLRAPQISPDGRLVTYLRGAARNKDRMDLWAFDLTRHEHRLLVDSGALEPQGRVLNPEEEQRRERQRTSSLSGILEYQFSPDGRYLLVPLGGDLYLYDLHAAARNAVRRLTHTQAHETDAKFSPRGHYVSFIRGQNLVVYDLATGQEHALTHEGGGTVSFGTAEFIAQEEMGRSTGYWWAPDEQHIAYARVDESPVSEVERFEIYADRTQVVRQRYPAAGGANASVQLFVQEVASLLTPAAQGAAQTAGVPVRVDLGADPDIYLARVNWFPDSSSLAVQRQSRDQKSLTLLQADVSSGASSELLNEHSDTWVDITDNLTFLYPARRFIWASSRSGFQHLYLYDWSGRLIRPLTQGNWQVTGDNDSHGVRGIDAEHGLVFFMANRESPLQRHLYSVSYTDPAVPVQKITSQPGWHAVSMSADSRMFLDTFSTIDQPPSLTLRASSGQDLADLAPNTVGPGHPYAPYVADQLPTEFGTLKASDGQTLYYQLIKPPHPAAGVKYPVMVDVYGGPGSQRVRNAWGAYPRGNEGFFRQYMAQQGYIVFTLDNRGSGSREVPFTSALYHRLGSVEVEDQVTGVNFLASLPYVDATRIGVFGWSYGGYMALMCLMQAPQLFAAAVAGAPVTDWRLYDTHYTERFMGTPQANPQGYENSSVRHYAAHLQGELLVMHGMADDNVLFTNSTNLFKVLQELDKPFDVMTYPGGKHALLRHANMGPHGYATIKRFFDRTIGEQRPRQAPTAG